MRAPDGERRTSDRAGGAWRRALIPVAAVLAGVLGYLVADWLRNNRVDVETTQAAPFRLLDLDGEAHTLADFSGRWVLLNFWAPWCLPCREEIPLLVAAQTRYAQRGLQVIGIAVDTAEAVAGFHTQTPFNFPSLLGGEHALALIADYGNASGVLPYSVLVAPDGEIRARHRGAFSAAGLDSLLTTYLPNAVVTPQN